MKPNLSFEYARKFMQTYSDESRPLCNEIGIPQTAFDILLFLANNPDYNTAKDVAEIRGLKANLVSINVDKLVKEGYLTRMDDKDDRRKVILSCTEKASPIIEKGRSMQKKLYEQLLSGISEEELRTMKHVMEKMMQNMDEIRRR